ncbi:MAG: SCO family protein [Litoreibacter sp.]|nr:SCO family protein [Litoreibacter sp.]
MNKAYAYTAGGLVLAMLGGLAAFVFMNATDDRFANCSESTVAGGANIGGPFELIDETGQTVTDRDVIDRPSLIYFGYTYCPDVCPVDVYRNGEAVDLLKAQGYDVKPVFISIDPERDTPDILAEFTDIMHPDMVGLTGSPEQVKAASQAYKTFYRKNEGGPEDYLVDHSTFTYLMAPEVGFLEFFRNDVSSEKMANTVACFVDGL